MEGAHHGLDEEDARRIAEALVRRHAAAPRAFDGASDPAAHRRALRRDVAALGPHAEALGGGEALAEVEARQARFLAERADLLMTRAGDGRILARAEALDLGAVAWPADGDDEAPVRIASAADAAGPGDVAVELAGLSAALLARGRGGPAERLLSHYAGEADDFDLYAVIDFHERAIAMARAARAVSLAGDAPTEAARTQLGVAWATARRSALAPVVVAMGGAVASGKSTLARALADRLALPRVVADRVRDHLLYGPPDAGRAAGAHARDVHETNWVQAFAPGFQARVYGELLRRAAVVLGSGRAVVLDACFPHPREREAARALARRHGLAFLWVECRVDEETWRARLAARDAASPNGGWREIADRHDEAAEPPTEEELAGGEHAVVDTSRPVEQSLEALLARLAP